VTDTVLIDFNLNCTVKRDAKDRWVTGCPALDLFSQGRTEEEAKQCLKEAIELWVEDCLERGTLEAALREVGFHKVHPGAAFDPQAEHISLGHLPEHIDTGTFSVHLSIPAYQAAAFLSVPG
jgi:predicted RNase H-like HicB family nuclease/predicted RNA binding protein YcfA (HicA-like mRNA interferase family)